MVANLSGKMSEAPAPLAAMASAAERAPAAAVGGAVRLGEPQRLRGTRSRSTVGRCAMLDGPGDEMPLYPAFRAEAER
jgi:hypothetical protein